MAAKCRMWSNVIVIVPPERQHPTGRPEAFEHLLIEQLVTEPTVERLDESVLDRLARLDVMPADTSLVLPLEDRAAG